MKTRQVFCSFLFAVTMTLFISGCGNTKEGGLKGFDQTESGLNYKMHITNPGAVKPVEGDFVTAIGMYRTNDTIFFDSRSNPNPYAFPIMPSTHVGDIFEGIKMLGIGDSATFAINADSLFLKTFQSGVLPEFVQTGEMVFLDLKVLKIQTREEFEADMRAQFEEQNPELRERRLSEAAERDAWLLENKITSQPTASGLYYVEISAGKGEKPLAGQTVNVHYTGLLLNGEKFDSSVDRGQPFSFVLGQGQVIQGWDEGIAMMKVGGKARFIIPSNLAYGDRGAGQMIPPYSSLVFEVELLSIND